MIQIAAITLASAQWPSKSKRKIAAFQLRNFPIGDRKGTTKKLCDKDFAERSAELSGAICLETLVLLGNDK